MGGRGSNGGKLSGTRITSEDWDDWSQDPSFYQRAERGEDISEDLDEMGIYESDYDRIMSVSAEMQDRALNEILKGVKTLYRGESFRSLEEAQRKYAVGNTITNSQLTSYSTDKDLASNYASMYGSKVAVVITNTSKGGDFVGLRAQHSGERSGQDREIITARGFKSTVKSTRYDKKTNTLYVTMENSVRPRRK